MQDEMESRRTGADSDRVLGLVQAGERLLEFADAIPHGDPAAFNDSSESCLFLVSQDRL
jgi:hypothetical protein